MYDTIFPIVNTFFTGLGITTKNLTVEIIESDIHIHIETPDSNLLIGMHGKNMENIQHLLSRLIEKKGEKFVHVHLEVNDYMKLKDEKLMRFLESKVQYIQSVGGSIQLAQLSSYDRKKAHGYIADKHIEGLSTHSEGEGEARVLILSYTGLLTSRTQKAYIPTTAPMSISDDGVGI